MSDRHDSDGGDQVVLPFAPRVSVPDLDMPEPGPDSTFDSPPVPPLPGGQADEPVPQVPGPGEMTAPLHLVMPTLPELDREDSTEGAYVGPAPENPDEPGAQHVVGTAMSLATALGVAAASGLWHRARQRKAHADTARAQADKAAAQAAKTGGSTTSSKTTTSKTTGGSGGGGIGGGRRGSSSGGGTGKGSTGSGTKGSGPSGGGAGRGGGRGGSSAPGGKGTTGGGRGAGAKGPAGAKGADGKGTKGGDGKGTDGKSGDAKGTKGTKGTDPKGAKTADTKPNARPDASPRTGGTKTGDGSGGAADPKRTDSRGAKADPKDAGTGGKATDTPEPTSRPTGPTEPTDPSTTTARPTEPTEPTGSAGPTTPPPGPTGPYPAPPPRTTPGPVPGPAPTAGPTTAPEPTAPRVPPRPDPDATADRAPASEPTGRQTGPERPIPGPDWTPPGFVPMRPPPAVTEPMRTTAEVLPHEATREEPWDAESWEAPETTRPGGSDGRPALPAGGSASSPDAGAKGETVTAMSMPAMGKPNTQYADAELTVYDVIEADADMAEEITAGVDEARGAAEGCDRLFRKLEELHAQVMELRVPGVLEGLVVLLMDKTATVKARAGAIAEQLPAASEAIATAGANAEARHRPLADAVADAGHTRPAERDYHNE
jgi:hypothetical protein